jgi:hypothetical protein
MLEEKICAACGRRIEPRRRWQKDWDSVRYCSERCRRHRPSRRDRRLEQALLERAERVAAGATFCPSEVARAEAPEDWRPLMEPIRRAARRLVAHGALEMLQKGRRVDPSTARGPIRLRRPPRGAGT